MYNPICSGTFSGYLDDVEPPPSRLSLNVLQQHVVPVLQILAVECQMSKVSHLEAMANGLISKLEAIHGTSFKLTSLNSSGFSSASGGGQASTIPSSTSMDEMKQKVGKLFHSGQPFWKK